MKTNVFFALFTLIFSTISLYAVDTWRPEGSDVTYGTPGKGLWHIGVNVDSPESARKKQMNQLNDLYARKVHPFQWGQHFDDEVVWHISGTQEALNKELKLVNESEPPAWIWESAPNSPITIRIGLAPNGHGRANVFQGTQIIASFACVSSNKVSKGQKPDHNSQPLVGSYPVEYKRDVHYSKAKESYGAPMKWAICFDEARGIFIHSRKLAPSHGCIGISVPAAKWLYEKVEKGTLVSIGLAK